MSHMQASGLLACVILGYIGIYLCRKNLSVAIPAIQKDFKVTNKEIGIIASYSTAAYMTGKLIFGPVIDRFGGRVCFLLALTGVAIFGGLGAFAVSLPMLTILYSANRLAGAAGWGSMVKQVPDWFRKDRLALPMAFLSLSFVFGGTCALKLAGRVDTLSGGNWRAVMGLPSLILVVIIVICWVVLPKSQKSATTGVPAKTGTSFSFAQIFELAKIPQFWTVCALSAILNITRETFNVWTVLFLKKGGGPGLSTEGAANFSMAFDIAGAVGILFLGYALDHVSRRGRTTLLVAILLALAGLIYELPVLAKNGIWQATAVIALIGFLSYGPYSLLAGILAVEIRGPAFVATVAGFVDGTGYFGASVMDRFFGDMVDRGGFLYAFHFLAAITSIAAVLCLFLRTSQRHSVTQANS
jgi:sugar phosphate permease